MDKKENLDNKKNINIDELIKNIREVLHINNNIKKVEKFLELLPDEKILELMINKNEIGIEQIKELLILLDNIKPFIEEYHFYLDKERRKLNKINSYIY